MNSKGHWNRVPISAILYTFHLYTSSYNHLFTTAITWYLHTIVSIHHLLLSSHFFVLMQPLPLTHCYSHLYTATATYQLSTVTATCYLPTAAVILTPSTTVATFYLPTYILSQLLTTYPLPLPPITTCLLAAVAFFLSMWLAGTYVRVIKVQ